MKNPHTPAIPPAHTGDITNQLLKDGLVAAANGQFEIAEQKIKKSSYWGEVGFVEASAVKSARSIIDAVPLDLTPEEYRSEIVRQFDERIEIYRQSDILDPDGYGLGTLYAILRDSKLFPD